MFDALTGDLSGDPELFGARLDAFAFLVEDEVVAAMQPLDSVVELRGRVVEAAATARAFCVRRRLDRSICVSL